RRDARRRGCSRAGRGRPRVGPEARHVAAVRDHRRAGRPNRRRRARRAGAAVTAPSLTADAPVNQSVERAVRLLGFFSPEEPELTLADMTRRLGTSRATTHRYTLALRRVGLLRFDPGAGVYSLGPRIVELAATALAGLRIVRLAGPTMERLVAELNETVVLSIWDGEQPVVVRVDDNTDRLV